MANDPSKSGNPAVRDISSAKKKTSKPKPKAPQAPAAQTAELDVVDTKTSVSYDGDVYSVDFSKINDIRVLEAFQRGNAFFTPEMNGSLTAIQLALGPDYETFKANQIEKHGSCTATAVFQLYQIIDSGAGGN